jgi:hypothetical protein
VPSPVRAHHSSGSVRKAWRQRRVCRSERRGGEPWRRILAFSSTEPAATGSWCWMRRFECRACAWSASSTTILRGAASGSSTSRCSAMVRFCRNPDSVHVASWSPSAIQSLVRKRLPASRRPAWGSSRSFIPRPFSRTASRWATGRWSYRWPLCTRTRPLGGTRSSTPARSSSTSVVSASSRTSRPARVSLET